MGVEGFRSSLIHWEMSTERWPSGESITECFILYVGKIGNSGGSSSKKGNSRWRRGAEKGKIEEVEVASLTERR